MPAEGHLVYISGQASGAYLRVDRGTKLEQTIALTTIAHENK